MTKTCRKCGKELNNDEFYGYSHICKECTKERVRIHREANLEKIREYDRNRSHSPKRQALRTAITKKRRHEVEGYQACHNKIVREIRNGTMIRANTCQICGNQGKTEAHHNNYLEKLKVLWLCPCCHRSFHIGKNEKSDRIRIIVNLLLEIRNDIFEDE